MPDLTPEKLAELRRLLAEAPPLPYRRNAGVLKDSAPGGKATAPDLDKLCRALGDALTQSGVLRDDALIVEWVARKQWARKPDTWLRITSTN